MSFLGLDIGTSSCKAAVFDVSGFQLACASREYEVTIYRTGWAELDSQEVGDKCLEAIAMAAGQCLSDPVQALSISSQGEAFTVLDSGGRILSGAMVSSDNRAAHLVSPWVEEFGSQRLYEKTGHTAHPIFTLFKLLWLKRNAPDIWKQAARILSFEDYLHFRLGVHPAISWSLAGRTMLFNINESSWDEDILAEIGLRSDQLSRPLPSGSAVGVIPRSVCKDLHLVPHALVVTGGHDQACGALGAGATLPGQAALTTGSVECITVAFQKATMTPELEKANLCTYHHAMPSVYATLAYNLTGGNLLRWFRHELGAEEALISSQTGRDIYDLLLEKIRPEPTSLIALPYFTGSGTPYFDTRTPGAILGLRLSTSRGEILQALLEALAFELRLNIFTLETSGISVNEVFASGGGAKNRTWLQLKANVLDRPIHIPEVTETGCLGGAILACSAVTAVDPRDIQRQWIKISTTVEPDSSRTGYYNTRMSAYQKTYATLRELALAIF